MTAEPVASGVTHTSAGTEQPGATTSPATAAGAHTRAERARVDRWRVAADILREMRREPGITRAAVAQRLGIGSGVATEVTARLREARLLSESDAPSRGRGRPTTALRAHPAGPLALVVEVRHQDWQCGVAALDGTTTVLAGGPHEPEHHSPDAVLGHVRAAVADAADLLGPRLRVLTVAVPGVVGGTVMRQASTLAWEDVDLATLVDGVAPLANVPLLVGNDATLAGVAEARTGAAVGARTLVHVLVGAGTGGALVVDGVPVVGATGAAGEFGHLPFGNRRLRCPCGARGCWTIGVSAGALARRLGEPEPADPQAYTAEVLARAAAGTGGAAREVRDGGGAPRGAAREALRAFAAALGAGVAGLVNALDPDVVTVGGIAVPVRAAAPQAFGAAYRAGLMSHRRADPPPVRDAAHHDGAWRGAALVGLDVVGTPEGLAAWVGR